MTPFLRAMRAELLNGKGFILFKNFPVQAWGLRKSAVAIRPPFPLRYVNQAWMPLLQPLTSPFDMADQKLRSLHSLSSPKPPTRLGEEVESSITNDKQL